MYSKIAHLTSVHSRFDTRIFHKMGSSLSVNGFNISMIVADGLGNASRNDIHIYDVGLPTGRLNRMYSAPQRIFKKAIFLDADLYHLHDPELIPIGLKLKQLGKKVIFDAHEDVPKQLLGKSYLNRPSRWLLSQLFTFYEARTCSKFDAIIAATPSIRDKYFRINSNVVDINNFPILGELESSTVWKDKKPQICYVGGVAAIRGVREIVLAMEHVKSSVRLQLVGRFSESEVEDEVKSYPGWKRVDVHGFLDREGVRSIMSCSVGGLVTLHPSPNYLESLPVKMFEYMSAGIPVIASDFPLWKKIIIGNQCGLCVDSLNPEKIARAIDVLMGSPCEAEAMGKRGRMAVQEHYNWSTEERKLLKLYKLVIKS